MIIFGSYTYFQNLVIAFSRFFFKETIKIFLNNFFMLNEQCVSEVVI